MVHVQLRRVPLDEADDATLAERASDGDIRAFEVLIRRFTPLLRAVARRTLGSGDEVDDVVQDTFVTAWERLGSLNDPAKVKSWLTRIASHRSIDRIRARRPHDDVDDVDPADSNDITPDRIVEARSREHAADIALRQLPDQQRRCWLLKEVMDMSYDEIAAELGVPESTVRGLLSRARKNMIGQMEGWR